VVVLDILKNGERERERERVAAESSFVIFLTQPIILRIADTRSLFLFSFTLLHVHSKSDWFFPLTHIHTLWICNGMGVAIYRNERM